MKRYFKLVVLLGVAGCFGQSHKTVTGLEGRVLPAFNLTLTDSLSSFNTGSIPKGAPFILFCYQPYCPFCRAQTEEIIKNMKKLDGIKIYMVSSWPYKDVQRFVGEYKLERYHDIKVVQDPHGDLGAYFQPKGVPFLAFYDREKKLKRAFLGKQLIDALIDNAGN